MNSRVLSFSGVLAAAFFAAGCATNVEPSTVDLGTSSLSTNSDGEKTTGLPDGEKPINPEDLNSKAAPSDTSAAAEPVADMPVKGEDVGVIETSKGRIVVMFYPKKAPKHVENFKKLANMKFYDGTRFHRCIPGFMIQGGDPNSKDLGKANQWGTGGYMQDGKEHMLKAEFNDVKHVRGILSMARSQDPDSASSQFFIMHDTSPSLDGQYSAFGKAVQGLDVVDAIVATGDGNNNGAVEPKNAVVLKSIRITKWPIQK